MLDLEEGEGDLSGGRNVDLAQELGHISVAVGVPISESDLGARIFAIGTVVIRLVIGECPGKHGAHFHTCCVRKTYLYCRNVRGRSSHRARPQHHLLSYLNLKASVSPMKYTAAITANDTFIILKIIILNL